MKSAYSLWLLGLVACGSSEPCPKTPEPQPVQTNVASATPCGDTGPVTADVIDKDVLALAQAAKNCPFENGHFDWECKGWKQFARENEDLFEGGSANATMLQLLENEDVRMRTLGAERGFSGGRAFFSDKKHAQRLLAVVDKERDTRLLSQLGRFVAFIDAEKTGLTNEIAAFTKHPSVELRQSFASYLLPQHPNAFSLGLVQKLLDDPDNSVRRAAIMSLSANGRTRPNPELCSTLKSQLTRNDKLAGDAIDAATSSKCEGFAELAVAEVEKRTKDVKKAAGSEGIDLRGPLSGVCWGNASEDLKKRVFAIAVKMAPATEDSWRRRSWLGLFRNCDVKRAKDALTPFLKDKDKDVADEAKEEIQRVEEELKRN